MNKMKIITTDASKNLFWQEAETEFAMQTDCMHVVNVFPELKGQQIEGFGGAVTEASVYSASKLAADKREEVLKGYYGEEGLRYNLARVHIHSCDFALGNYTYVEEGDKNLSSFDVAHDREYLFPFLKEAMVLCDGNLNFLASPWSPPAYMKTNGEMNHGGKLKAEYAPLWAAYYVKFIKAYAEEGIHISYITVQNEPMAVQTWDSCIYEAAEEGAFVKNYLAPALKEAGLSHIQIFVWDHNKEEVYDRAKATFEVEGVREEVAGIAVHWYTGDHFDALRAVKQAFPEKKLFFTEGCVEYSRFADSGETQKAEMYAHDILGNLKAGVEAYFDWNILLDEKGGPNHVGNFCAAPMMLDGKGGVEKRLTYYYIGHFSRYIKKGAVQLMTSTYTDKIETVAFVNPDGERVVVILNKSSEPVEITLRECGMGTNTVVMAHSIVTLCYTK